MFIRTLFSDPQLFFSQLLIVVFSICCHEYVHALTAYRLGDPTAAMRGHLTLNPLKQMGFISLLMLFFIGIAWGQVPVDPRQLRGRHAPALTAAAGPLTNLVLSLCFSLLFILGVNLGVNGFASTMLLYGAVINMVLTLFNLLPLPGLDGWQILRNYWKKDLNTTPEFFKGVFLILLMLTFTCFRYLYQAAFAVVSSFLELAGQLGVFR